MEPPSPSCAGLSLVAVPQAFPMALFQAWDICEGRTEHAGSYARATKETESSQRTRESVGTAGS
jgi:hypothetical protein